eukprot:Nitzschia sp. Nitz4//scaffold221_size33835//29154//29889//NITZ4_007856-RA/size33835-augustus-gene-0.2-mRNA-1//1//CDS//3329542572//423//frame0
MGKRERLDSGKKEPKRHKKEKVKEDSSNAKSEALTTSKSQKSLFLKKKVDIELSLLPGALHNIDESVQDSIGSLLMRFSDGLGGIMMAYENVKCTKDGNGSDSGWILNELPWIHYTASCDALVLRPYVGCEMQGVVNECFPSHLGILVFNYFNAMVSAEPLRNAGFFFDADLQKWVSEGGAQSIAVDSKITFEVTKIHECEGTVSLEGTNPALSLLVET